jgi:hypothetical protein
LPARDPRTNMLQMAFELTVFALKWRPCCNSLWFALSKTGASGCKLCGTGHTVRRSVVLWTYLLLARSRLLQGSLKRTAHWSGELPFRTIYLRILGNDFHVWFFLNTYWPTWTSMNFSKVTKYYNCSDDHANVPLFHVFLIVFVEHRMWLLDVLWVPKHSHLKMFQHIPTNGWMVSRESDATKFYYIFFLFWVWTSDFSSSYSINRQSALHCHSARSTSTSPSVSLRLKRRTRIVMAHQCCCLDNSYTVSCHCWNNGHQWDWFIISVHSSYIESIHTYI